MSMTFYCCRADATKPVGSHGPLTEIDNDYHFEGMPRVLDPTPEQELAAGWCHGPNFSNSNAGMILRSLGYDTPVDGCATLDPYDLRRRVTLARAVPPIEDDGQDDIVSRAGGALMIDCGVRPGYFADAYERIANLADQACEAGVEVVVA